MVNYSPQYVDKFSCLGSKCPETCCHGMSIDIDKKTHSKYQKIEIEGIKKWWNCLRGGNMMIFRFRIIALDKFTACSFFTQIPLFWS